MRCKSCNTVLGRKVIDPRFELCNGCIGSIREFVNFLNPDHLAEPALDLDTYKTDLGDFDE